MKIFVFDTETNGLHGASCLEFYGVKYYYENNEVVNTEEIHRYYFPDEGYFNMRACSINGLSEVIISEKREGCDYPEHFKQDIHIQQFVADVDMFVAHNINFDLQYIDKSYLNDDVIYFDTMRENRDLMKMKTPRGFKLPKLIEAAEFYNLNPEIDNFHGAKYDVEITSKIFFKMIEKNLVKHDLNK
jgi:DNA polymerase III epsilon subunit-like protein